MGRTQRDASLREKLLEKGRAYRLSLVDLRAFGRCLEDDLALRTTLFPEPLLRWLHGYLSRPDRAREVVAKIHNNAGDGLNDRIAVALAPVREGAMARRVAFSFLPLRRDRYPLRKGELLLVLHAVAAQEEGELRADRHALSAWLGRVGAPSRLAPCLFPLPHGIRHDGDLGHDAPFAKWAQCPVATVGEEGVTLRAAGRKSGAFGEVHVSFVELESLLDAVIRLRRTMR